MLRTPVIDMEQTGKRIRQLCKVNGYSVRELQSYLHIGCPQSIYNWYYGKTLPSLDHLFALSYLMNIPMSWLLVVKTTDHDPFQKLRFFKIPQLRRLGAYRQRYKL